MNKVSTIGLDLAKQVFQVHGADATGAVVFRKRLRRTGVLQFFASQAFCRIAMEACASSHYWGRELSRIGHEVRLIPAAYVKPFVKRQKNDAADAEAICDDWPPLGGPSGMLIQGWSGRQRGRRSWST